MGPTHPVPDPRFMNLKLCWFKYLISWIAVTYDHRLRRIGHPVRSAIHKPQIGRLVVGWVTTSEYLLLYVFFATFLGGMVELIFFLVRCRDFWRPLKEASPSEICP